MTVDRGGGGAARLGGGAPAPVAAAGAIFVDASGLTAGCATTRAGSMGAEGAARWGAPATEGKVPRGAGTAAGARATAGSFFAAGAAFRAVGVDAAAAAVTEAARATAGAMAPLPVTAGPGGAAGPRPKGIVWRPTRTAAPGVAPRAGVGAAFGAALLGWPTDCGAGARAATPPAWEAVVRAVEPLPWAAVVRATTGKGAATFEAFTGAMPGPAAVAFPEVASCGAFAVEASPPTLGSKTGIGALQFRQGTLPPLLASARATSSPMVTIVEQTLHRICIAP